VRWISVVTKLSNGLVRLGCFNFLELRKRPLYGILGLVKDAMLDLVLRIYGEHAVFRIRRELSFAGSDISGTPSSRCRTLDSFLFMQNSDLAVPSLRSHIKTLTNTSARPGYFKRPCARSRLATVSLCSSRCLGAITSYLWLSALSRAVGAVGAVTSQPESDP
jgi:hypothetical protein